MCPYAAINPAHRINARRPDNMTGDGEGQELMDAKVISEAGLPSRHTTGGQACAPYRSFPDTASLSERAIARLPAGVAAEKGMPSETDHTSGVLWIYARTVGDARHRAPSRRGKSETELRRYSGMRLSK